MPDLNRRAFPIRICILAVAALLLLGAATESHAATDAECKSEWAESEADDTCTHEQIEALGGDRCEISARCPHPNGAVNPDTIRLPLDNVDELHNCGGWLTIGSC